MNARTWRVVSTIGWALLAGPALADVYTWVDEEGTVHFQDEPPAAGTRARRLRSLPPERPRIDPPPARTAAPGDAGGPAPPRSSPDAPLATPRPALDVELYSTSWCPWCRKAREYFKSRGIGFTDHDIERDPGALRRKLALDGDQRVPTAVIGGKVIRGYLPSAYQAALEQR